MSLSNILVPNSYVVSIGSLTVTKNETITGNLAVGGTLAVTGASTLTGIVTTANDVNVGGDLLVDGTATVNALLRAEANLIVPDGIYIGAQNIAAANLLSIYNYQKFQTLAGAGGLSAGLPLVAYCRIGNMVTVSFQAGNAVSAYMTAGGATVFTWAQLGAIGTLLQADYAKLPVPSQEMQYLYEFTIGGANHGAGILLYEAAQIKLLKPDGADTAAADQLHNFSFSYIVDY